MDTIIIIRDSVAMCVNKTAVTYQPLVKVTETNWLDVAVVGLICLAVAVVAIYAIYRFFKWKDDARQASKESTKNPTGETCPNNKVKAEYISKLLKHLESMAIKENTDKYVKEGSDNYIEVLKNLIETGTITNERKKA